MFRAIVGSLKQQMMRVGLSGLAEQKPSRFLVPNHSHLARCFFRFMVFFFKSFSKLHYARSNKDVATIKIAEVGTSGEMNDVSHQSTLDFLAAGRAHGQTAAAIPSQKWREELATTDGTNIFSCSASVVTSNVCYNGHRFLHLSKLLIPRDLQHKAD
jgi:hypothetical protein